MRTFFALACLVAAAAAAPQLVPDVPDLSLKYLPVDPQPALPYKSSTCPPAKDIYKTTYVTQPVNKVVESIRQVVVPQTNYVTRTQVVPKIIDRQVVTTRIIPVTEVKQILSTVFRTVYKTVTERGQDRVIKSTVIRNVPVVKTQYVTLTKTETRTVPKVEVKVIRSTQIVQKTVKVPEVSTKISTERQQLPDTTRTVVKYVTKTFVKTQTLPPQVVVRTDVRTVTKTEEQTRQDPARTVTVDRTQVKTVVQPVVKTEYVPQVITKVQPVYITREVIKYVTREVVVPVTKVQQRVVSVTEYKTEIRQRRVTDTQYRTVQVTNVQQVPGRTVVETKIKNVYRTEQVPGNVRTVVKDRTNFRTITNVATVVKNQISTAYVTNVVKEPCGGYRYDTPKNPLNF